jgi:hypothetical protein
MPRTSKSEAELAVDTDQFKARYAELGPYTVGYESFPLDVDPAPLFAALPDGRCQCPHWGIVTKGSFTVQYADNAETVTQGDVFHMTPGHVPTYEVGTELVQFSPTDQLKATDEAIQRAMALLPDR